MGSIPPNISGSFCIFFNTKAASLQPMILMDPVNCNMLDAEAFMVINREGEHLGILLGVRRKMEGRPTLDIVGIEFHVQVGEELKDVLTSGCFDLPRQIPAQRDVDNEGLDFFPN